MFLNRFLTEGSIYAYAPPSLCRIDGEGAGDFGGGASMDALADKITAQLENEPDEGSEAGDTNLAAQSADADGATGDEPGDDDAGEAEPEQTPAIEPPLSWKAELKARWSELPADLQRDLAQWESERNTGVNKRLQEAADATKAIEPERAALAQERQRYADQLGTYIALTEALDPILADGMKTDWAKSAQEDPAGTQAKWFAFQNRRQELTQAVQQRDQLMQRAMENHLAKEGQALVEAVPEWKTDLDAAKTGIDTLRKVAVDRYGFSPQEVAIIRDHRVALVLKDAAAYHDSLAAQAKGKAEREAAEKAARDKRQTTAPRLAPSGVLTQGSQRSARTALHQRAKDFSRPLDERAEDILALL